MKLKSILAVAVVAASTFAGSAQASLLWTVSGTGTISSGKDTSGVFGTKNQSLAGLAFTETITTSIDPTKYTYKTTTSNASYMYGYAGLPAFTDTVTVNGHTVTFNITHSTFEEQLLGDGLSKKTGSYDEVYTNNQGSDALGNTASAELYLYSVSTAFVPSLDFGQTLTQVVKPGIASFGSLSVSGSNTVNFSGTLASLTVNAENTTNVPEPTSIALFGLGLLGMSTLRRRKSK